MKTSLLDDIAVHNAGERLILTGSDEASVNAAIEQMQKEGATGAEKATRVGSKWVGTVINPELVQCTVERVGFVIYVRGPSESAILTKATEFQERGALVQAWAHEEDGLWVMELEDIGARLGIGTVP